MRLESVTLTNFRCFAHDTTVHFNSLTTLVGKNDAGKSAVLEALEIFFNNDIVAIEPKDACVHNADRTVSITCEFSDPPSILTLDAGASTSLAGEHLLTRDGRLKICKRFDCSKAKPVAEVFLLAFHPTAPGVDALLELKEKDLQALVKQRGLDVSLKGNPGMRLALWNAVPDLKLAEVLIPVSKAKEDSKRIWDQLEKHLPLFALFQSDRRSQDSDDEVQNPMRAAVTAAIADVKDELDQIQKRIAEKTLAIAADTHAALRVLAPALAQELTPQFSEPTAAKWAGLFSVNMATAHGIPLNKRGSGIRRLVLVGFFKAEAERRLIQTSRRSIIYSIEEPETSQHPANQRILIEAFKSLTYEPNCQVVLTTHSPGFASELPADGLRFVTERDGKPDIQTGVDAFGVVATSLGLTPDSRVRLLACVEGPTDVQALQCLSRALNAEDSSIPDLASESRVAFVVLGGSTLKHWVAGHYLRELGRPEVHIYDGDVAKYADDVARVNARTDGSWAVQTRKHEIESYLHPAAIEEAFGVTVQVHDGPDENGKATPRLFAEAYSTARGLDATMGDDKAKQRLSARAFPLMTASRLRERDPEGEVEGWLRRIGAMLS